MKRVLEDLFFGEIQPNISNNEECLNLSNSNQIVNNNEEVLLNILEGNERKLFLELINAQSQLEGVSSADYFINGFKLGARIIAESLIEF